MTPLIKITIMAESALLIFWAWLLMTDTRFIAILGLIGTLIAAVVSVFTLIYQHKTRAEVKVLKEQTDGKMNELLEASKGKVAADATVKGKDEVIEILKQVEPLKKEV